MVLEKFVYKKKLFMYFGGGANLAESFVFKKVKEIKI